MVYDDMWDDVYIYNYNIYIYIYSWKAEETQHVLVIMEKIHTTIFFFVKSIFFFKKLLSNQRNIAVLPVAKPYFFDMLLNKQLKNIATLTQVAPDDQSRNDKRNGQGRSTKNIIIVFQVDIDTVLILI